MKVLIPRLIISLTSLALLVNGVYEYMLLGQTSDAALSIALCALMINWYLDIAKQDKKV